MKVVRDPGKAASNLRKHGIRFSDAEGVLFDPNAIAEEDPSIDVERRFMTMGIDSLGIVLVVDCCFRGEDIRLISARRATKREREQYETRI
ncbi:MAG: BrnT family toxin [Acidobacteria bacterium]|nr:BrnT family toxin [Acidobacteriota bacterium]